MSKRQAAIILWIIIAFIMGILFYLGVLDVNVVDYGGVVIILLCSVPVIEYLTGLPIHFPYVGEISTSEESNLERTIAFLAASAGVAAGIFMCVLL
jgi:hypothetical protein